MDMEEINTYVLIFAVFITAIVCIFDFLSYNVIEGQLWLILLYLLIITNRKTEDLCPK